MTRTQKLKIDPTPFSSNQEAEMAVARVTEIIAGSSKGFEDAVTAGVKRASKTLKNVRGAWVDGTEVMIEKGKIVEWRVRLKVTFILEN